MCRVLGIRGIRSTGPQLIRPLFPFSPFATRRRISRVLDPALGPRALVGQYPAPVDRDSLERILLAKSQRWKRSVGSLFFLLPRHLLNGRMEGNEFHSFQRQPRNFTFTFTLLGEITQYADHCMHLAINYGEIFFTITLNTCSQITRETKSMLGSKDMSRGRESGI
jgi:hypothetical protein